MVIDLLRSVLKYEPEKKTSLSRLELSSRRLIFNLSSLIVLLTQVW